MSEDAKKMTLTEVEQIAWRLCKYGDPRIESKARVMRKRLARIREQRLKLHAVKPGSVTLN